MNPIFLPSDGIVPWFVYRHSHSSRKVIGIAGDIVAKPINEEIGEGLGGVPRLAVAVVTHSQVKDLHRRHRQGIAEIGKRQTIAPPENTDFGLVDRTKDIVVK